MPKPDTRAYGGDVPADVVRRLRVIVEELPDAYEEPAWVGRRWRVRKRTFAHVLTATEDVNDEPPQVVLTFSSEGEELEALRRTGPPFRVLGWGRHAIGMELDAESDWEEVRELMIESYCVMAPKKLAALAPRPAGEPEPR